ncbi:ectoine/hydroxyectoine ABC transporter substrate-binding protein EhuB [Streptomyces sp. A7024]|uniref:Ectoine/hydroxyectoine ABC transporter substrate-binding protein EhuB n=1 Tax=Streptomyces coryli TaxID=1128680 RepID=A0A6G4UA28_9ACTN|nr:ectoine/hydroxyectoine ABC transporter substrate-binding protein EhuB [Streptomyces coryli]NGN68238.1 ectoine/hydroxyectoine ABC transporter substrate-binding protein EhuB [Streptomyces coryli]
MAPPHENDYNGITHRRLSRRSLLAGTASVGAVAAMGAAAGCSRAEAGESVEGGDLLEELRDRGMVKVGIASEPPFGFLDEDGEATGEAPAIAKRIFKALGVPKIEAVPVEFGALIPGLKVQQFDVVSAGMYIQPDRCAQVIFSDPDYLMKDAFIVKKGNPEGIRNYEDIAKKGLKLASGTAYAEIAYAEAHGIKDILILPDQVAGLEAVAQGRVHAFAGTNVTVQGVVKGSAKAEATKPFQPYVDGKPAYGAGGFAFRPAEKNLRDAFNRELHKLKDSGELLRIVKPFGFTKAEMTDLTAKELCG